MVSSWYYFTLYYYQYISARFNFRIYGNRKKLATEGSSRYYMKYSRAVDALATNKQR